MRLKSVETTPNPNSMKLNFHESLGKATTYSAENADNGPDFVRALLNIAGVKSVFVCADFITLNRSPDAAWDPILIEAKRVTGGDAAAEPGGQSAEKLDRRDDINVMAHRAAPQNTDRDACEKSGQVSVVVQTFKGIPIQVKVQGAGAERRVALSARFSAAAQNVQSLTNADFLKERYWADWGVRYGEPDEIAAQVAEEIEGTLDESALQQLCDLSTGKSGAETRTLSRQEIEAALHSSDWHVRLRMVQELGRSEQDIPFLEQALLDEQMQVRRFAAAGLGATASSKAVAALCRALLSDTTVAVRRTAGDALSDIGDASAEPEVCKALSDENKLVRWRACRFLSEVGTGYALEALNSVLDDAEFEVRLEAAAAVDRILKGDKGLAPVWKRMHEGGSGT